VLPIRGLFLCERHPEPGFAPPIESPLRGEFLKWMVYLTNTIQAELMLYFYAERYVPSEQVAALKATAVDRVAEMFGRIDAHLADRPYLLGERISAADIYLFMVARWTRNTTKKARDLPHLGALLARVMARPKVQEAYAIERIVEPLY
jgi:glutathione S-transferase